MTAAPDHSLRKTPLSRKAVCSFIALSVLMAMLSAAYTLRQPLTRRPGSHPAELATGGVQGFGGLSTLALQRMAK